MKRSDYREIKGKLGVFGWISRILLLGWQALMLIWLVSYTGDVAPLVEDAPDDFSKAGATVGIAFSWGMILFFWVGGTIILGLFALLTRRTKMLIPVERHRADPD